MRGSGGILGLLLTGLVSLVACSSSSNSAAGACTSNGNGCVNDTDCCTGNCQLEGDSAYCQDKSAQANAQCSVETGPCTENRHCCGGLCKDNVCVGNGSGVPGCLDVGDVCQNSDGCCSLYCIAVSDSESVCAPPPEETSGDGGACGDEGATCTQGGDCCSGFCLTFNSDNVCSGSTTGGGGGGGTNCGAAGATCRTGNDCCSSQCQSAASGAQVCN